MTIFQSQSQIVLDLETMATPSPGEATPATFEIGIIHIDPTVPEAAAQELSFHDLKCSPFSALAEGFRADKSTLLWHLERQSSIVNTGELEAMVKKAYAAIAEARADYIWAKAPDFDCAILSELFHHYGLPPIWEYYQLRDIRTVIDGYSHLFRDLPPTAHQGGLDCRQEAEQLRRVLNWQRQYLPEQTKAA